MNLLVYEYIERELCRRLLGNKIPWVEFGVWGRWAPGDIMYQEIKLVHEYKELYILGCSEAREEIL